MSSKNSGIKIRSNYSPSKNINKVNKSLAIQKETRLKFLNIDQPYSNKKKMKGVLRTTVNPQNT